MHMLFEEKVENFLHFVFIVCFTKYATQHIPYYDYNYKEVYNIERKNESNVTH